jgi:uncharacterized protein (PEP-CTERM system associated)
VNTADMAVMAMDMASKYFYYTGMNIGNKISSKCIYFYNIKIFMMVLYLMFSSFAKADEKSPQGLFTPSFDGSIKFLPSIAVTETWSDNINLQNSNENSGWISEISPGIVVNTISKKMKLNVDYSLHKFINKNSATTSSLQHSLSSLFFLEAIEKNIFFEANGNISQRTISAFGKQVIASDINNSNKSEVSSFGITPYFKGNFSNYFNYEGRYSFNSIKARNISEINSTQSLSSLKLGGDMLFNKFRWSVDVQEQLINNEKTSDIKTDNFGFTLTYLVDNNLNFYGTVGREVGNYLYSDRSAYSTSGAGASWAVSERTKFSADMNKHQLGNMHKLSFEHRTSRTSWSFRDSKSISSSNNKNSVDGLGDNYYLLYNQFSLIEPDPVKRDKMVREFMANNGIGLSSVLLNGYLTSGTSIQRSQDLSFVLLGLRDTITFSASKNTGANINSTFVGVDDLSKSTKIRQDGFGVIYSHKITPYSVVSTQFSIQKTKADFDSQNSLMKMVNINYTSRLTSSIFATMSWRHVIYSANISSYKENAIVGKLMVQF